MKTFENVNVGGSAATINVGVEVVNALTKVGSTMVNGIVPMRRMNSNG